MTSHVMTVGFKLFNENNVYYHNINTSLYLKSNSLYVSTFCLANDNIAADCKRFDYAHLPVDHETNVVEAEVCLCYGDL